MTGYSRVAGRAAGALVVLAALSGLAACTPADRPMTAIRAVDGQPVVLLADCSDFQVEGVSLYPEGINVTVAPDSPKRKLQRDTGAVPESLPLFGDPPAGWTAADDDLTALAAGQPYGLSARAGTGRAVVIVFTAADLAALGPDEVLIGKKPSSHEKVTEREFRKRAKEAC